MTERPARRRMAPEKRREEILRSASELFAHKSYSAASVADIARAAGSSASLVIVYFGSKQALYLEVLTGSANDLREGLLNAPGEPSMERLRGILEWYADYARTHRNGFLSLLRGEHEAVLPEASEIFEHLRADVIAATFMNLADRGYPQLADDPAAELALRGYLGFVDATVVRWLSLPPEQAAAISSRTIADLGVGAYTGCLTALLTPPPT